MAQPYTVLGITLSHGDSSAALIVDGCLVAAAEEERFTRVKHYALFPAKAIAYCLNHAKVAPANIEIVAIARRPWNAFGKKAALVFKHPNLLHQRSHAPSNHLPGPSLSRLLRQAGLTKARLVRVEHHRAH